MSHDGGDDNGNSPFGLNLGHVADTLNNALGSTVESLTGYNTSTGKFNIKKQYAVHAFDEGMGEITGRNLQRDAMAKADARITQEDNQRAKDLLDQQQQDSVRDMQASRAAAGIRDTASIRSGTRSSRSQPLGAAETDFLGL